MEYYIISYKSVSHAMKVRSYFKQDGSYSYMDVIQTPGVLELKGCSYSIKVGTERVAEVRLASQRLNIPIMGVYSVQGNSEYNNVIYTKVE